MNEVDAQLIQGFLKEILKSNEKMERALGTWEGLQKDLERVNKNVYDELERSRAVDRRLGAQESATALLNQALSIQSEALKTHLKKHWQWLVLIVAASGTIFTLLKSVWK